MTGEGGDSCGHHCLVPFPIWLSSWLWRRVPEPAVEAGLVSQGDVPLCPTEGALCAWEPRGVCGDPERRRCPSGLESA